MKDLIYAPTVRNILESIEFRLRVIELFSTEHSLDLQKEEFVRMKNEMAEHMSFVLKHIEEEKEDV